MMTKKYALVLLLVAGALGCKNPYAVEFNVKATGLKKGVFVINDDRGQAVYGANIVDGKCTVKDILKQPGFYSVDIQSVLNKPKHTPFEIYLEPGTYTITADAAELENYPKIESSSVKQQQLSLYYPILDEHAASLRADEQKVSDLEAKIKHLTKDEYRKYTELTEAVRKKSLDNSFDALSEYLRKNPQSEMAAHLMSSQNYEDSPVRYAALFQLMSNSAKASAEGLAISDKLKHLVRLLPGNTAPAIEGKVFDGKAFETIKKGKKIFLIDFWRSGSMVSRSNHDGMMKIYNQFSAAGFEVISVSLDTKSAWWTTAVAADHLPWPQMADLKGDDSPNAANWNIKTIPSYFIVDANWKIITGNVAIGSIKAYVTEYLDKHQ